MHWITPKRSISTCKFAFAVWRLRRRFSLRQCQVQANLFNLRAASLTVGHVERNPVVRPQAPVPNYWIHRKGSYERIPLVAFAILNSRYTFT